MVREQLTANKSDWHIHQIVKVHMAWQSNDGQCPSASGGTASALSFWQTYALLRRYTSQLSLLMFGAYVKGLVALSGESVSDSPFIHSFVRSFVHSFFHS